MAKDQVKKVEMLVIGGSAGSLDVLLKLLPVLPEGLPFPIVVVLHRKHSTDSALAELFSSRTVVPVKEIEDKESSLPGHIYLVPGDYHILFESSGTFSLDVSEKVNFSRPSIDVAFESAAEVYGASLCCLLLSGSNADGVEGLKAVKERGGMTLVQDPDTAEIPYMPQQAILQIPSVRVVAPDRLAGFIEEIR